VKPFLLLLEEAIVEIDLAFFKGGVLRRFILQHFFRFSLTAMGSLMKRAITFSLGMAIETLSLLI